MPKSFLPCVLLALTLHVSAQDNHKMEQVENNLKPWFQPEGAPAMGFNIYDRMKAYNIPSVSIAVIDNGKISWAKAYGLADVAENKPATTQTIYQAASISKPVNAIGVMKLVEGNKLSLDKDIRGYLKTWKFPENQFSNNQTITLRNLMSHTAGLNVHGFGGYEAGTPLPDINQILNGEAPANSPRVAPIYKPGERVEYSGGGTTIIRKIIEDNIDKDYAGLYQKMVLTPLHMTHSTFVQPLPPALAVNAATAYKEDGAPLKGKYHVYPEVAPDGLWTTPSDLATFAIGIQQSLDSSKHSFLRPATVRTMLTPVTPQENNALGFFIETTDTEKFFQHSGGNEGFRCMLFAGETNHQGVAVMINSDNGGILREIVNAVAEVYGWKNFYKPVIKKIINPATDSLQAYTGKYLIKNQDLNLYLEFVVQNGLPGLIRSDRKVWEQLYFTDESNAFLLSEQFNFRFTRNASSQIDHIVISNSNVSMNAQRVTAE
ncbi:serine hydrolase domain-containing protein [Chitinophaga sp. RAB17]|uniref:serine hydrolase domain-containing protein n=1 Tax=Chitinophaga sp. RAB17 TaxID=3233049 RepID=UPI003F906D0B